MEASQVVASTLIHADGDISCVIFRGAASIQQVHVHFPSSSIGRLPGKIVLIPICT